MNHCFVEMEMTIFLQETVILVEVHNLSTIPAKVSGTNHMLLDGRSVRLHVINSRTLEVLDDQSKPIGFRADSSMGFVEEQN